MYEYMFKRKSVRKYLNEELDKETINKVKEYAQNVKRLFPEIKVEIKFLERKDIKTILSINAQQYIAVYSEEKEGYLTNVGFILEQIDLFLSSIGLGSCWLGMANTNEKAKSGLKYIIQLAFGKADNIYRNDISEFKRKDINKVSNIDNRLMHDVRLAPSANNGQPWYFVQNDNSIDIYMEKSKFIKIQKMDKMKKIDIGIATCFLDLSIENDKKHATYQVLKSKELDGYEYIISAEIN